MKLYFKMSVFVLALLLFICPSLSKQPFCSTEAGKASPLLLDKFKRKFIEEMQAHYTRLVKSSSISQKQKEKYLEKYSNPDVRVCINPQNTSQKMVYIEYEKNWWGSLYFAVTEKDDIVKWTKINTHGAVTTSVRWGGAIVFYEDSTHSGAKTQNTCQVQKNSIHCRHNNR